MLLYRWTAREEMDQEKKKTKTCSDFFIFFLKRRERAVEEGHVREREAERGKSS